MNKRKYHKQSFLDTLQQILAIAKGTDLIKVKEILGILSEKGAAALLIVLSIPFCIPIQIPGFSTPFGIVLAFLGIQIAFRMLPWWPQWILEKEIKSQFISHLILKTIAIFGSLQKILYPRLVVLTQNPFFYHLNGLLVFLFGFLLSLPLPIPLTNLISAFPILCIGLGLLENDGLPIMIAYLLALTYLVLLLMLFI